MQVTSQLQTFSVEQDSRRIGVCLGIVPIPGNSFGSEV